MKRLAILAVVAGVLILLSYIDLQPLAEQEDIEVRSGRVAENAVNRPGLFYADEDAPIRAVLDISVHTLEGLRVLFDRAEQLAMKPQARGKEASIVLVLHGPEVEFFNIRNYEKYKDIVDQAARLDAFDVVDVKICQTMMGERGLQAEDIPAFIEQVPLGPAEVERLLQDGYVAF